MDLRSQGSCLARLRWVWFVVWFVACDVCDATDCSYFKGYTPPAAKGAFNFLLPKSKFFTSVTQRAQELENCTNWQVRFLDKAVVASDWGVALTTAEEDLGYEQCTEDEVSKKLQCGFVEGIGRYDAYLMKTGWVAPFAERELLGNWNELLATSETMNWLDVFKVIRKYMSVYDGKVVVLPFDADFATLVVRGDLLESYAEQNGVASYNALQTWEELAAFAAEFDGKDLNGDGIPDRAACNTQCNREAHGYMALGGPFYMIYASIIQTSGPEEGIHFDPITMDPLLFEPAMEEALRLFRQVTAPCPLDVEFNAVPQPGSEFNAGKCAFFLTHPGPANGMILTPQGRKDADGNYLWQPTLKDGTPAVARRLSVPGSRTIYNRNLGQLEPMNGTDRNWAPLITGGNVIATRNSSDQQEIMATYLEYLNVPSQSLSDTVTPGTWNNHWRLSHVVESARATHEAYGWPAQAIDDLFKVTKASLEDAENPSLELRLRGYNRYVYQTFDAQLMEFMGYKTEDRDGTVWLVDSGVVPNVTDLVARLVADMQNITDAYGRLDQVSRYRKSLQLPALTAEERCFYHLPLLSLQEAALCDVSGQTMLRVLLCSMGGVLVIAGIGGGFLYWKMTATSRKMKAALKTASLVEATVDAISSLDFEGSIVKLLREVQNPNTMQLAFLRIIDIIEEYKAYLPPNFGMSNDDEEGDCVSDEDCRSAAGSDEEHRIAIPAIEVNDDPPAVISLSLPGETRTRGMSNISQLAPARTRGISTISGAGAPYGKLAPGGRSRNSSTRSNVNDMQVAKAANKVAVGLEMRNVTVMVTTIGNWRSMVSKLGHDVVDLHASFLDAVYSATTEFGGVMETFSGETFVSTWGASGNCTDQANKAASAALKVRELVDKEDELAPVRMDISIALESGKAMTGNLGNKRQRRFSVIGVPMDTAHLLVQLTGQYETPNNIMLGPMVRGKLLPTFVTRTLDLVSFSEGKEDKVMAISNLIEKFEAAGDEWMYELEQMKEGPEGKEREENNQAWVKLQSADPNKFPGTNSHHTRLREAIEHAKAKKKYRQILRPTLFCPCVLNVEDVMG